MSLVDLKEEHKNRSNLLKDLTDQFIQGVNSEVFQRVVKNVKETAIIATEIDEDMAHLLKAYEMGRISLEVMRLILFASIAAANEQITSMELSIQAIRLVEKAAEHTDRCHRLIERTRKYAPSEFPRPKFCYEKAFSYFF